ncbi:hypothetical protein [Amphibacillus cookii]
MRASTLANRKNTYDKRIVPYIGHIRVKNINPDNIHL